MQAVGLDLVQHHAHLIGLLSCLVDRVGLSEVDQLSFCIGGDQGAGGADQQIAPGGVRTGNIDQFRVAGFLGFGESAS